MSDITQETGRMKARNALLPSVFVVALALGLAALAPAGAQAASYDPYTSNAIISPAPLLPVEFNGTGTFTFQAGNNGGDTLPFPPPAGNPMGLEISLGNGVPNVADPNDPAQALTAISGPLLTYFNFTYNPLNRTYTGTQKAPIPAFGTFQAAIQYRLTANTFIGSPFNGANVNVQPPGFTNPQPTDNDQASSYTYVEAKDYGDVPLTYGAAVHAIDLTKTAGVYNKYIYLGTAVDPEPAYQASFDAKGDDNNQTGGLNTNDESGVTWPASLQKGQTTNVGLSVTNNGYTGFYLVQHWIDWDRNGVFDAGEAGTNVFRLPFGSDPTSMPVAVPNGVLDGLYYARVRVSTDGTTANSAATNGEVEDYLIVVGNPTAVTMGDVDLVVTGVPAFLRDIGANDLDAAGLRAMLQAWDPVAAAKLKGADVKTLLKALRDYLDPDGDGQVIVFRWETLAERGTIGFYAERNQNGVWSRINAQMLPGLIASPMGAQYWLADPGARATDNNQYKLIELDARGRTNEYGPFDLRATTR